MKKVYLDSAATTQMRTEVIDKMTAVMHESYGNPSSSHSFGRGGKSLIEAARKTIAQLLNVSASEIIFTSGGTEADNLILISAVRDLKVKRIITTRIEHHAVLHTVEFLHKQFGTHVDYVNLEPSGHIDYANLEVLLARSSEKTLVSLMHINNEIGTILDLNKVAALCYANGALFHSDMVQSVGHFNIDLQVFPVDFIAASAHKFHGPKGVGFVYIKKHTGLKALIHGGEQERGVRAGTEAVHNIVGLEAAMKLAYADLEQDRKAITALKTYFVSEIKKAIPEVVFNADSSTIDRHTYTLINVCLPISAKKASLLLFQLDLKGIACSRGSACQSGSQKGSHVLAQILSDADLKKASFRFSFSRYNTLKEIDYVVDTLKAFVNE